MDTYSKIKELEARIAALEEIARPTPVLEAQLPADVTDAFIPAKRGKK